MFIARMDPHSALLRVACVKARAHAGMAAGPAQRLSWNHPATARRRRCTAAGPCGDSEGLPTLLGARALPEARPPAARGAREVIEVSSYQTSFHVWRNSTFSICNQNHDPQMDHRLGPSGASVLEDVLVRLIVVCSDPSQTRKSGRLSGDSVRSQGNDLGAITARKSVSPSPPSHFVCASPGSLTE